MVERFVKEYASYKIKAFPVFDKQDKEKRKEYKKKLDKIVKLRSKGFITCDEAINLIINTPI